MCLFFFLFSFFLLKIYLLLITPFHFLYALTTAKGRTNIELREQFILADGVSQSMSAFKPKHNAQQQQRSVSTAGPITKVKWLINIGRIFNIYLNKIFYIYSSKKARNLYLSIIYNMHRFVALCTETVWKLALIFFFARRCCFFFLSFPSA